MSEAAVHVRPVRSQLSLEEKLLFAAVAYLVAIKLYLVFVLFPIPDEAYYWMWGRHPALSYFDHPPLTAWGHSAIYAVFGRSLFALRLPGLLAFAGTVWIFYRVALEIGGDRWRLILLRGLAAYLGTIVFGVFCTLAFPDYLLVFLLVAATYLFARYLGAVIERGEGRLVDLFAAAVLLGLAGLTKYNAVFIGVAVVATIIMLAPLRVLLVRPATYLAGFVTLAIQAPILIWNATHDFASFRFHLVERQTGGPFEPSALIEFALINVLILSPFVVVPVIRFFAARPQSGFESAGRWLAIWAFAASVGVFGVMSADVPVTWWWNIVAFVPAMMFIGAHIGALGTGLHAIWGVALNTIIAVSITIVAVPTLIGLPHALDTDTASGWERILAAVAAARSANPDTFVAANRYETASQLGFVLDDPDIVLLSSRRTAFDDWTDEAALRGRAAIVLVDHTELEGVWQAAFAALQLVESFSVRRLGSPQTYSIYLADGYQPAAP